jgi:hypothetical protein
MGIAVMGKGEGLYLIDDSSFGGCMMVYLMS